jgi:NADPH-dependent curcumin reductase CurA
MTTALIDALARSSASSYRLRKITGDRSMPHAWHLARRPQGMPRLEDFALKPIALPSLGEGQIRVRNRWLSVDPYMRGRMNDVKSYVPPFALGEPMSGGAIGEVVESRAEGFAPGDLVQHMEGWRDEAVLAAAAAQKLPDLGVEPQAFLGQLGMPGMTAYFGLLDVASAQSGDTVFVSAAAGAVGSTVVQIAKAKGMTVVGSAGGADKCSWVRSLGADAVIDYKAEASVTKALLAAAPGGIDVYFDNVGGDHLDAALAAAKQGARFAICGMIDVYNSAEPTRLRYLARLIGMRIRMQGFIVSDYFARMGEFQQDMGAMLASGALQRHETVFEGLEAAPEAFLGLFTGKNMGKMLVRI